MRKTTIKTNVTFTSIEAIAFNSDTNELQNITIDIPATAKTEKGLEKLINENIDDNLKVVKVLDCSKYSLWYEMDKETFLTYATLVNEK